MKTTKIFLTIMAALIFTMAAYAGYFLAVSDPMEKPPIMAINTKTLKQPEIVIKEGYAVCDKYHLSCVKSENGEETLNDLSESQLKERYPEPRWQFTKTPNQLIFASLEPGLCQIHKEILHLGVNESGQYLAIWYGPAVVGSDGGVYQVTDLAIDHLSEDFRADVLAGNVEIYSEDELIGLLDGMSEHQ